MADDSKPTTPGFNWRGVIYAMIPIGFVVIVLVGVLSGEAVQKLPEGGVVDEELICCLAL